jgi:FAD/FMN-containing dehydrogenase
MKYYTVAAVALVLVADVQGFAPVSSPQGQVVVGGVSTTSSSTQLQGTLFDAVAGMDLFAPKKDQNTYGARNKKDVSNNSIAYCSTV